MSYYDPTPAQIQIANIGRRLMDISATTSMKGLKDDEIGRYNRMASFGDALTRLGTTFGPRDLKEVLKVSKVDPAEAQEFVKLANSTGA